MKEETIRKLVKLVEEADIESLTVRHWWTKVQIVKKSSKNGNGSVTHAAEITIPRESLQPTLPSNQNASPTVATEEKPTSVEQPVIASNQKEVKSPMVGTFYTSPNPDAPPFADIGQTMRKGETLCIIEAMKLMNEIEAEFDCKIVKRLVGNAEPVEFDQALFLVEPV